jgi:purine-binding chemotaxis protein CheW
VAREARRRARPARKTERAASPATADAAAWTSREESLTFPGDEPEELPRAGRIALPSSGLAADILARPDAASVPSAAQPVKALEPRPAAPEAAPSPVHSISFFSAPVREERKAVEATEHLATFFLGDEEYGVDVRVVQEIIRVTEITQVPRAPEFVKGVINLRGRIIPVVDLKRKLGLGDVVPGRQSRVVVVKLRERLVGLLVDGASQVLKVLVSSIEAAPEELTEAAIEQSAIRGVAKLEKRLIILIDLARILAMELREESPLPSSGAES